MSKEMNNLLEVQEGGRRYGNLSDVAAMLCRRGREIGRISQTTNTNLIPDAKVGGERVPSHHECDRIESRAG